MSIFGERLIEVRKRRMMTQAQLAQAIGVSRSGLSGYETEGKDASYEVLRRLVDVLGVTSDYLIGVDDAADWKKSRHIGVCFYNLEEKYANASPDKQAFADDLISEMNVLLSAALDAENSPMLDTCVDLLRSSRKLAVSAAKERENE